MRFFSRWHDKNPAALAHYLSPLLFLVAGIVGVVQMNYEFVDWRGYEMVTLAANVANHFSYADPFHAAATGPTAANPPAYPIFLALLMKVLGAPVLLHGAALIGSIIANALTAALLPYISILFFGDVISGAIGSILWLGAMQPIPVWDTSYTVVGLCAFVLLSASHLSNKRKRLVLWAATDGTLAGVLFLLNPSSVLIFGPWLIYLYVRQRKITSTVLKYCTVVVVAACILPGAWVLRNHDRLGAYVVRTNLGMTLYSSNNDCAQPTLREELATGCYTVYHPNLGAHEAQLVRDLGEVRYDRFRIAGAKRWITSHPGRFVHLTLARVKDFWLPPYEIGSWYHAYCISLITLLSVPGMILMMRRREPVVAFISVVLFIYPLMYYIVVADIRYRFPVLWLSLLPAGYFVRLLCVQGFSRLDGRWSPKHQDVPAGTHAQ